MFACQVSGWVRGGAWADSVVGLRATLTCTMPHARAWMAYGSSPAQDEAESDADSKSEGDAAFRMRLFEIPEDGEPWEEIENFDSDDLWSSKVCVYARARACACACFLCVVFVDVVLCVGCVEGALHAHLPFSHGVGQRVSERGPGLGFML